MAKLVVALFENQKSAGEAIAELKQKGFTNDISLIAKDSESGKLSSHQVKQEVSDGITVGAATGASAGLVIGILAGLSNIVLPGIGPLLIGGSLAATWGIAGGVLGAFAGGIIGALIDIGIPEQKAKMFDTAIRNGEVFVATSADADRIQDVSDIYERFGASEIEVIDDTRLGAPQPV